MGNLDEKYTIYVLEHEGYGKGVWFENENFGTEGKERALERKARLSSPNDQYRVIAKTIIEREIFE